MILRLLQVNPCIFKFRDLSLKRLAQWWHHLTGRKQYYIGFDQAGKGSDTSILMQIEFDKQTGMFRVIRKWELIKKGGQPCP